MSNIPTREHGSMPKKQPTPPRTAPKMPTPPQYPPQRPYRPGTPPRVQAPPGTRYAPTQKPLPRAEQLRPLRPSAPKPQKANPRTQKHTKKPRLRQRRSSFGDFMLAFIVALIVFGIAAIFVCSALISLFTP